MPRRIASAGFTVLTLLGTPADGMAQVHGPPKGTLVVSGGAPTTSHIIDRFIALAGGPARTHRRRAHLGRRRRV